jgi:hypothetical protein
MYSPPPTHILGMPLNGALTARPWPEDGRQVPGPTCIRPGTLLLPPPPAACRRPQLDVHVLCARGRLYLWMCLAGAGPGAAPEITPRQLGLLMPHVSRVSLGPRPPAPPAGPRGCGQGLRARARGVE